MLMFYSEIFVAILINQINNNTVTLKSANADIHPEVI